ncbi:DpnD/PcfM family protein [[Clostridium] innocuum]
MKKYLVEITETLQKQITITASSREEAEQKAKENIKMKKLF